MLQEKKPYKNVMEILVDEEIQHQLTHNKALNNKRVEELSTIVDFMESFLEKGIGKLKLKGMVKNRHLAKNIWECQSNILCHD
jgi:hypothetical protein